MSAAVPQLHPRPRRAVAGRRSCRGVRAASAATWCAAALAGMLGGAPLAAQSATARAPVGGTSAPAAVLAGDQRVVHVLNRLAFGPRPGDVARVRAMGVDTWIARQLEPSAIPDATADRVDRAFPRLALAPAALVRQAPPAGALAARARSLTTAGDSAALRRGLAAARQAGRRLAGELAAARVARAVASDRQLEEVLTDFWLNHFNVYVAKGPQLRYYLPAYERTAIRPHVLGRFRDLLGAVAHSPTMLYYLDNWQSRADSGRATLADARRERLTRPGRRPRGLNENWARELLELHTLGVDGGYTQQDVIEVARAFTGWTVRPPQRGGGFVFVPALHDAEAKTVLGHRLPAGRGEADGEAVLDLLARHPATARHIARSLAVRFVSDTPPAALVERAAATFRRTDGDLRAVVRTIVTSPEFLAPEAWRAKVKSPFEVVVSALRALDAEPDLTPRTAQVVARLGQPLYGHQAPDGWPETGEAWMNTGAILDRINFGLAVAGGRLPGASLAAWPAVRELAGAPREAQVDAVVRAFLGGEASPETRAVLRSGLHPLLAGMPDGARPDDSPPPRLDGLPLLVGLALGAPEFQRR